LLAILAMNAKCFAASLQRESCESWGLAKRGFWRMHLLVQMGEMCTDAFNLREERDKLWIRHEFSNLFIWIFSVGIIVVYFCHFIAINT